MRERQTDKTFVQFTARVYGYRAAFVLLRGYIGRGADTIGRIIARWAPSRDGNDTQAYIRHVSRSTGIGAGQALSFEDKDALVEIVRSMAHMESGIIEDRAVISRHSSRSDRSPDTAAVWAEKPQITRYHRAAGSQSRSLGRCFMAILPDSTG